MFRKQIIDLTVTLFGLSAARAFALLSSIVIARIAGASTFGEFSLFITIFVIASEVPNAIDTTFIRFSNSLDRKQPVRVYQSIAVILKLIYSIVVVLLAFGLSRWISEYVFNKPEISNIIQLSVLSASMMCIHTLLVGRYHQQKLFKRVSLIRPMANMLILFSLTYMAVTNVTLNIRTISNVYLAVTGGLAVVSLMVLIPSVFRSITQAFESIEVFFRVSAILVGSSLISLVGSRLDIFFLTSTLTFNEVGQYGAAIRMSVIVALISAAMTTVYVPNASAATKKRDDYDKYAHLMKTYCGLQTLLAFLVIWQMDTLVALIFGNEYENIKLVAIVLIVQVLFEAYARGFQALVQCGPRPQFIMLAAVVRLVISAILLVVLVPLYGPIGGAISVTIASAIVGSIVVTMAYKDCIPARI